MTDNLKQGILLKIDDTLETLQLRLMLNKETIITDESVSPTLKEAIDFYQNVAKQNRQANLVIKECEDTIKKLSLLKQYTSDLSINAIVSLYNNSKGFSITDFQNQLMEKLGARQSSQ